MVNVTTDHDAPDEDGTLAIAASGVLRNDDDTDGNALTASLVNGPANGTLQLGADGGFSYTPTANFNGRHSFTYRANDGDLDSAAATVTITVGAVNTTPQLIQPNTSAAAAHAASPPAWPTWHRRWAWPVRPRRTRARPIRSCSTTRTRAWIR